MRRSANYQVHKQKKLADPQYARVYLQAAVEAYYEDHNRGAFLLAIRDVVEAQGTLTEFAHKTQLSRQSLYKALSPQGNPRFDTLDTVLFQLGFQLKLEPISKR